MKLAGGFILYMSTPTLGKCISPNSVVNTWGSYGNSKRPGRDLEFMRSRVHEI